MTTHICSKLLSSQPQFLRGSAMLKISVDWIQPWCNYDLPHFLIPRQARGGERMREKREMSRAVLHCTYNEAIRVENWGHRRAFELPQKWVITVTELLEHRGISVVADHWVPPRLGHVMYTCYNTNSKVNSEWWSTYLWPLY